MSEIKASGGHAIGVDTDVTDSASVASAFETIKKEMGDAKLAAAIYNVGGGFVRKPFLDLSEKEFKAGWESNGYINLTFLMSSLVKANPCPLSQIGPLQLRPQHSTSSASVNS